MRKEGLANLTLTGHIENKRSGGRQLVVYSMRLCEWITEKEVVESHESSWHINEEWKAEQEQTRCVKAQSYLQQQKKLWRAMVAQDMTYKRICLTTEHETQKLI